MPWGKPAEEGARGASFKEVLQGFIGDSMKGYVRCMVLLCCVLLGCEPPDSPSDDNLSPASTIKPGTFTVSVDVQRAVFDRPIVVTTTCVPTITGKGYIGLRGNKWGDMLDWSLLSPTIDTVSTINDPYYTIHIPASFNKNQTFMQRWEIRLLPRTGPAGNYYIGAHIYTDSIFIADSNRMYWIHSDVARKHSPRPLGWQPDAINEKNVYLGG